MKTLKIFITLTMAINLLQGQVGKAIDKNKTDYEINKTEIGTAIIGPVWIADLTKHNIKGDDYYILTYQNKEFYQVTDIQSIEFYASNDELDYIFNELKACLKEQKEKVIKLGEDEITFGPYKKKNILVTTSKIGGGYFVIPGAKYLFQLFGKPFEKKEWKNYINQ